MVTDFLILDASRGRCWNMVAIGYVRVSTGGQVEDGVSLDAQREKIQAWAKLHDEDELVIYEDAGISGSSMEQRPGLQQALREVCRRKGVLVVYALSRLARSTKDTLAISDTLEKSKAELVSLSERIDTTSASGKMVFRMLAVLAEFERDQVSERTRVAMGHLRASGRRYSRFAPFGWDLDEGGEVLRPNPAEQAAIARMVELREEGLSYREVADRLSADGVVTKAGLASWSAKSVWAAVRRACA